MFDSPYDLAQGETIKTIEVVTTNWGEEAHGTSETYLVKRVIRQNSNAIYVELQTYAPMRDGYVFKAIFPWTAVLRLTVA